MANWEYTIRNGKALHKAIESENIEAVVECLLKCYRELYDKLSEEDMDWRGYDIEDTIDILTVYHVSHDEDDEDDIDNYLDDFYDLCDELRAWITL